MLYTIPVLHWINSKSPNADLCDRHKSGQFKSWHHFPSGSHTAVFRTWEETLQSDPSALTWGFTSLEDVVQPVPFWIRYLLLALLAQVSHQVSSLWRSQPAFQNCGSVSYQPEGLREPSHNLKLHEKLKQTDMRYINIFGWKISLILYLRLRVAINSYACVLTKL